MNSSTESNIPTKKNNAAYDPYKWIYSLIQADIFFLHGADHHRRTTILKSHDLLNANWFILVASMGTFLY